MHAKRCKSHCNGGVKVALAGRCAALRVANRIVMVVSKWLWVVGCCARGKCTHRVAYRIVMVVSKVALGGRCAALC